MKRLAVIGHPVAHSRSPAMQTAALRALGLADEWSYEAIEIPPIDFEQLTRALPAEGFVGANVTIPHKQAALALADTASAAATEIGAANTLSFAGGEIRAENTDAPGLLAALGRSPAGKRVLVLGAGGSARAAAWSLAGQGATVEIWNRTPERADELTRDLSRGLGESGDLPLLSAVSTAQARAAAYELIVNCTAVGLEPDDDPFAALPLDRGGIGKGTTVIDLVYGEGETVLARAAREAGARVVEGLEVLVRQGAESLRIWTGEAAPLDAMRDAARGDSEARR
jgi:shikimate dehydrogenase